MRRNPARTGFTLVELMVVIGIIGVLIAIAVPAYSSFRKRARATATAGTLSTLDVGIVAFRADSQLGGKFPMSYRIPACADPHNGGKSVIGSADGGVTGAELLAWALVGADLLGTPGFKNLDGDATDPEGKSDAFYGGWTSDTGKDDVGNGLPLYALDPTNGQPVHHRSTFVDPNEMKFPKPVDGGGRIVFEYEDLPKQPATGQPLRRPTIAFLDAFGQPILYYRATRTAQHMASWGDGNGNPVVPPLGIYDLLDNDLFTGGVKDNGSGSSVPQGVDFGAGTIHPLGRFVDPNSYLSKLPAGPILPKGSFQSVLQNTNITAKYQPYRDDSYLLISAGPDGLYGTGDDVANFPINQ